jgi:hypothetical protein
MKVPFLRSNIARNRPKCRNALNTSTDQTLRKPEMREHNDRHVESVQPVAKTWTAQDWNRERERAHRAFNRKAAEIANASANGNATSRKVREFLGDSKDRLSAALRALGGQPESFEAFTLRNQINLWAEGYPPVNWYWKKKGSGGHRPICILPLALKAAHIMLAAVIRAVLPETSTLYGIPGRGVADAARNLKTLQNTGFVHLAKADVVNCFQAIDPDALYQLPLPMEVIRQTLDHRNLNIAGEADQNSCRQTGGCFLPAYGQSHKASGPSGLLQGSPASSIIFAWLLKNIPTSDDARVMLCFDNIVVAATSPEASRRMMETLTAYLGRSPAGPLAMCEPVFADQQPLEFLGGLFDPCRQDIGIAHDTLSRIERRLDDAEEHERQELAGIWAAHQRLAATNSVFRAIPPTFGHYPNAIWHALRDTYTGLSFLEDDCPELILLLETSAMTVDQCGDGRISHLHQNLFAPAWTQEAATLRHILRSRPSPPKRKG